jgi:hypothetical protein
MRVRTSSAKRRPSPDPARVVSSSETATTQAVPGQCDADLRCRQPSAAGAGSAGGIGQLELGDAAEASGCRRRCGQAEPLATGRAVVGASRSSSLGWRGQLKAAADSGAAGGCWGVVMAVGGSVRGRRVVSVAILTVSLAVAGCGGGRTGRSAPSSRAAAKAPATTSGSGAREVRATVSGRALVGQCVGPGTDAATVVLEVGMGAPRDALLWSRIT